MAASAHLLVPIVFLVVDAGLAAAGVLAAAGTDRLDTWRAAGFVGAVVIAPGFISLALGYATHRIVPVRWPAVPWTIGTALGIPWLVALAWAVARAATHEDFAALLGLVPIEGHLQPTLWLIAVYATIPPSVVAFWWGRAAAGGQLAGRIEVTPTNGSSTRPSNTSTRPGSTTPYAGE